MYCMKSRRWEAYESDGVRLIPNAVISNAPDAADPPAGPIFAEGRIARKSNNDQFHPPLHSAPEFVLALQLPTRASKCATIMQQVEAKSESQL